MNNSIAQFGTFTIHYLTNLTVCNIYKLTNGYVLK